MHPMVDMAREKPDTSDIPMAIPVDNGPQYPWDMKIAFDDETIEKLEIDPSEAFVGGIVHLHALARIKCVRSDDGPDGKCCRIELQIEDLCVESEDEENEEKE